MNQRNGSILKPGRLCERDNPTSFDPERPYGWSNRHSVASFGKSSAVVHPVLSHSQPKTRVGVTCHTSLVVSGMSQLYFSL